MKLLDGSLVAAHYKEKIKEEVKSLISQGSKKPHLAAILVGNNPASEAYVGAKVRTCEEIGFASTLLRLDAQIDEASLLKEIAALNENKDVDGILVQLPLPKHIREASIINAIDPSKDVDGFHISNAGLLMTGKPLFRPCTPYGVMKMLESEGVHLRGAVAVVIGASNIVGKPMTMLLQSAGATVTICNSKTRDLGWHTRHADIVVVATGRPRMIDGSMIKPGAVVIDVGINRGADGKLCGDVDFDSVIQVASAVTPVPGGVGPMTIAMLLVNTLEAAERAQHNRAN